jgi:protein-S-isoprenylcysteine O-methyltransferase Ste14
VNVCFDIYSGLLVALLGTALMVGEWRGLLGLAFAAVSFVWRARARDALMQETFGDRYLDYRRHTPALLPFLV